MITMGRFLSLVFKYISGHQCLLLIKSEKIDICCKYFVKFTIFDKKIFTMITFLFKFF